MLDLTSSGLQAARTSRPRFPTLSLSHALDSHVALTRRSLVDLRSQRTIGASVPRPLDTKSAFDVPLAPDDRGDNTSSPNAIHDLFDAGPLATVAD